MSTSTLKSISIFESVFDGQWRNLPLVLKKRYGNRSYSTDQSVFEGVLDISCRGPLRLMRPLYRLLGTVPIISQNNVPVTVSLDSSPNSETLHFSRKFNFQGQKPYTFHSQMIHLKQNEVIEIMRFGICWRCLFSYQNGEVRLRHRGYAFKVFGKFMPLPISLLLGKGDAVERAIDEQHFNMQMKITHCLFGVVYCYKGRFKVAA